VRRSTASIAANPVLIGAATTLVIVVAVFLAYNANQGLPFVPTYNLKAQVPNAANLVKGNDVRIGGTRVGIVDSIRPVRDRRTGAVSAVLGLKLETTVSPLPRDSTVLVRSRSALGLKYVDIARGRSRQGFADGATLPARAATPAAVELDEVLNMFDDDTRAASQVNLREFGNALAGRGQDLNLFIEDLNPLLGELRPVMRNLADPRTRLGQLFRALGQTSAEVAPVAEAQGSLFRGLDATFSALASVAPSLQESIERGPEALDASVRSFRAQRPFLANAEGFFRELGPGATALRAGADPLADALEVGTPAVRRSVALNRRLVPTFQAVRRFAEDPLSSLGIRGLTTLADLANPIVAELRPAQTVCNYVTLFFRNAASLLSIGDANGTWQRFIIIATPTGPNSESGPSSGPARGGGSDERNFLHANPYPNSSAPGEPRECEAGNETYAQRETVIGNTPSRQRAATEPTTRAEARR